MKFTSKKNSSLKRKKAFRLGQPVKRGNLEPVKHENSFFIRLNTKGKELHKQGKYWAAIDCYEKVLYLNPHHITALYNIGNSLHKLGKYEKAQQFHERALRINSQM